MVPARDGPAAAVSGRWRHSERDTISPTSWNSAIPDHRAARRQFLRNRALLPPGTQGIDRAVDLLTHADARSAAAASGRGDQRLDRRPRRFGQVARMAQLAAGRFRAGPMRYVTHRCDAGNHASSSNALHRSQGTGRSWLHRSRRVGWHMARRGSSGPVGIVAHPTETAVAGTPGPNRRKR